MLGREKNQEKNSSDSSATPLRTGMFQSRPFSDPTVSDEVSPHKQELPDLQTQLERGARFNQSLSRMKVHPNKPVIQPKITVGAPGDKYEQEADQMAQQVMSMPAAISHPPIQRLEMSEEEKEQVHTKPLAASITPLVQRETAPEELEEEKEPLQMKRSLQETAEVSIQRDGTEALPAVPNYQLTPPSWLQPPTPSSRYGLGQNFQLHLDPQIQAMAFQHVQQQMEPAKIRAALSQVNLGLTALPAPSASGPTATPTPNPSATPSPSPAAPLVPREPDTPRPATAGDLMKALRAVPAINTWIRTLQTRATEQMMRDWRRLSTGEQVGTVSSAVVLGAGALAGILSDPNARQMALSQLNGRVFPVPGLNWLSLEINTGGNNLMLGGHVDIGSLLPPSLGFGPSSAQPIGGPPTPQPFVPGQPSVQREATPEAEEEKVQMKPLANAMIQREAMPEEAEEVQTQPSLQRAAANGSHDASSNIESQLSSSQGGGSPLSEEVRSFMEPRIGADFGSVRVHTDSEAVQMNQDLNAQAFTHGSDIYFGAGKYNPSSSDGKRLLAHELTHVVQQTGKVQLQTQGVENQTAKVTQMNADFGAAVQKGEWSRAAVILNGFAMFDILPRVEKLNGGQLDELSKAATETMKGWPPRVQFAIEVVKNRRLPVDLKEQINPDQVMDAEKFLALDSANPAASTSAAPSTAPRGPSKGSFAPPTPEEMAKKSDRSRKKWQEWLDTRDAKAQTFGAADYEDYVRNMLVSGGSVFGRQVPAEHPVHPLFLDRLEAASKRAETAIGSGDFGIEGFGGQDNRPGNHAWGIAIDIDSAANPYAINESGEQALDELIEPVYERIAQALLHRSSVLTRHSPSKPTGLQGASYTQVAEESDAMVAYFSVLGKPEDSATPEPSQGKGKKAPKPLPPPRKLTSRQFDPADLAKLDKNQVRADYELLLGKGIKVGGDVPFVGGGPGKKRDPARGFLSIREEVIKGVRDEKLRWGGTDFVGASGDMMHIDDGNRHADYIKYGKKNSTEKRKKET